MESKKLQVGGKPVEEGYVINKFFEGRFDSNANVIGIVIGRTGSGKSWSCISMCETWYKHRFNKPFPQENICFSLNEAGKRIHQGGLEKGEFIIVEEAGVIVNALEFQNKVIKFFHYVLQSFRCKNIGIIFNLPNLALVTKSARTLAHIVFETKSLDRKNKLVELKPLYLQTNPLSGKTYPKFLRQRIDNRPVTIKRIFVGKPKDKEFLKEYERRKNNFVDETLKEFIEVSEKTDDKKDNKEDKAKNFQLSNIQEAVYTLYKQGITNQNEIAKIIGCTQQNVSKAYHLLVKNDLIVPVYLEKALKHTENRLQAPAQL